MVKSGINFGETFSANPTYEKVVANAKEAIESLIIAYEADNEPLPKPLIVNTIL
ncbi:type II toxin-antitoxin system HicB family antitoxin [Crocosphaera watsonii WH 8501]|uniref:type II toxin-antitoxin system HicB family antitoxin n=1 Tax=Crocosphaera watsonii TaxID=263511 RepID=UPI000039D13F|nr:type II toxin-antitoxin system HicB family antitoxin [Crocosphaera watsonii]